LAAFGAAGIFDAAERQIRHYSKAHLLRATAGSALSSLLDLHSDADGRSPDETLARPL
jgi:hypothetical protein